MNKDAAEKKGKRSEVNSVYHYLAMCALFHLMHSYLVILITSYQGLHHRSSGVNKYLDFFSIDLMLPPKKELVFGRKSNVMNFVFLMDLACRNFLL